MHIGADEYDASLADDYNNFVNEMVSYRGFELYSARSIVAAVRLHSDRVRKTDPPLEHERAIQHDVCQQKDHQTALVSIRPL